jgi:serine protease Do
MRAPIEEHPERTQRTAPALSPPEPRRIRATTAVVLCLLTAMAVSLVALSVQVAAAPTDQSTAQAASVPGDAVPHAGARASSGDVSGDGEIVVDVYDAVAPAVVAIQVSGTIPTSGAFGQRSQGGSIGFQAAGSGVIVDPDGLILTNRHVVGDADKVTVLLADGRELPGTVDGLDTLTDLALVHVDATDLPAATIGDSADIRVGQVAIAIGNPEGDLPSSVTAGVVSALDREIVAGDQSNVQGSELLRHLIQHDASINPGNSGGPLLDRDGRVVGINTAVDGGAQGIGFAIPIDLAKPIIEQVRAGGTIERPYIGIHYTDVDAQLAADQGLPVTSGALIQADGQTGQPGIVAGGPADKAGLRDGDIVTAVDSQDLDPAHPLDLQLLAHEPGDTITLTIRRGDRTLQAPLTLGTRPADGSR